MRRSSFQPLTQGEPLIVVEESLCNEEDEDGATGGDGDSEGACGGTAGGASGGAEGEDDEDGARSPSPPKLEPDTLLNPYLLSPWRDTRKRSLPTPACTTGITASQVRRLSERGPDGGPSPREQAFLATLSAAPAPQPGGRRHSVVTISRAPPTSVIFGRNRRESIAVLDSAAVSALHGSSHNLQLDIMDDIADIKSARKKGLRGGRDLPTDGLPAPGGSGPAIRRYSDIGAVSGAVSGSSNSCPGGSGSSRRRRASEQPPGTSATPATPSPSTHVEPGIVCSNTDLMSIMSLTSSAQEIHKVAEDAGTTTTAGSPQAPPPGTTSATRRGHLKGFRSNSFDVGLLHGAAPKTERTSCATRCSSWFSNRHQPMATKDKSSLNKPVDMVVSLLHDKPTVSVAPVQMSPPTPPTPPKTLSAVSERTSGDGADPPSTVMWDNRSGSLVDANVLGSAIEGFLTRDSPQQPNPPSAPRGARTASTFTSWLSSLSRPSGAIASTNDDDVSEADTCNTLCATLKDLFVK